jgi:lysylphosphatidylglycerol synthase-like protein
VLLLKKQFPVSVATASLLSAKLAQALARVLFVSLGMVAVSWSLRYDRLPVKSLTIGFLLTAVGVVAFLVLQIRGLSGPGRRVLTRLRFLGRWAERMEHGLERVDAHLQELYGARPRDFVVSVMLCLGGLAVGVVQIWLVVAWIGLNPDWVGSFAIEVFACRLGPEAGQSFTEGPATGGTKQEGVKAKNAVKTGPSKVALLPTGIKIFTDEKKTRSHADARTARSTLEDVRRASR